MLNSAPFPNSEFQPKASDPSKIDHYIEQAVALPQIKFGSIAYDSVTKERVRTYDQTVPPDPSLLRNHPVCQSARELAATCNRVTVRDLVAKVEAADSEEALTFNDRMNLERVATLTMVDAWKQDPSIVEPLLVDLVVNERAKRPSAAAFALKVFSKPDSNGIPTANNSELPPGIEESCYRQYCTSLKAGADSRNIDLIHGCGRVVQGLTSVSEHRFSELLNLSQRLPLKSDAIPMDWIQLHWLLRDVAERFPDTARRPLQTAVRRGLGDYRATCMALEIIGDLAESFSSLLLDVAAQVNPVTWRIFPPFVGDRSALISTRACKAIGAFGAKALPYVPLLVEHHRENSYRGEAALTALANIREPRETIVPLLVNRWNQVRHLAFDNGASVSKFSDGAVVSSGAGEEFEMNLRVTSYVGKRPEGQTVGAIVEALCCYGPSDQRIQDVLSEIAQSSSSILRYYLVANLEYKRLAPKDEAAWQPIVEPLVASVSERDLKRLRSWLASGEEQPESDQ